MFHKILIILFLIASSLNAQLLINGGAGGGGSSGLSTVTLSNVVYVAVNGDDTKGKRSDASLPFATLGAAQVAAISGDTVEVLPGTYSGLTNINLGKNGVDWYFEPNTTVQCVNVTNTANDHIFGEGLSGGPGGAAMSYHVRGYGTFVITNQPLSSVAVYVVCQTNANSVIDIQGTAMWARSGGTAYAAAYCGGGTQYTDFTTSYAGNFVYSCDLDSSDFQYIKVNNCNAGTQCFQCTYGTQIIACDTANVGQNGAVIACSNGVGTQIFDINKMILGNGAEGFLGGHGAGYGHIGLITGTAGETYALDSNGIAGDSVVTVDKIDLTGAGSNSRGISARGAGTNYFTVKYCLAPNPIWLSKGYTVIDGGDYISTTTNGVCQEDSTSSGAITAVFKNVHMMANATGNDVNVYGTGGITNYFYGGVLVSSTTGTAFCINSTNTANDHVVFGTLYGTQTNHANATIRQGSFSQSVYAR